MSQSAKNNESIAKQREPHATSGAAYHHGGLREALLSAALAKIEHDGLAQLSLRALARDIGVSPTAPYRHFDSKRGLLAALAQRGFESLAVELRSVIDPTQDVDQRLLALGIGYIEFAVVNPTSYHLMFGSVIDDFSEYQELQTSADGVFAILLRLLTELIADGGGGGLDLDTLGGTIWSAVHGVASLQISDLGRELYRHVPLPPNASGPIPSVEALRTDTEGALRLLLRGALLRNR